MATTGPDAVMTTLSPASCWPNPFDLSFVHGEVITDGRTLERLTVRAAGPRGDELLLVHSRVNGDLMFPGGGVEAGENHHVALARELLEEQGGILKSRRSLSRTQQQVRVVRNKIELIQRDRKMTAEEKRRRIDEMLARRNDLVYQAVNKNKANWE